MGELGPILKGIGAAATNPLAFVAYIIAIGAWVFLRLRMGRNNNLLKCLTVLPEEDRFPALKAEMGTVPLNEGRWAGVWSQEQIDAGRANDRLAKERYFEAASTATAASPKKRGRRLWRKLKWW
jgi:hypothetical protein